eukprot:gene7077-9661_t
MKFPKKATIQISNTSISTMPLTQIRLFPEYTQAESYYMRGDFNKAIPYLIRVKDVLKSLSSLSYQNSLQHQNHISQTIATMYSLNGNNNASTSELNSILLGDIDNETKARITLQLSLNYLFSLSIKQALEYAQQAMKICEENDLEPDLFGNCYCLLGITSLLQNNIEEAETYLQLSARWSQNPLSQFIALSNLGCLHLSKFFDSIYNNDMNSHENTKNITTDKNGNISYFERENKIFSKLTNNNSLNSTILNPSQKQLLKDAISHWEEAMLSFSNIEQSQSSSGCGPIDNNPIGMTGLPNDQMLNLKINTNTTNDANNQNNEAIIDENITEYQRNGLYATVQCNLSEAYSLLDEKKKSEECISNALKTIDNSNITSVNNNSDISILSTKPILGRALNYAAYSHLLASQAVTSEGLFRSSFEKLKTPFALHDPRFQYEHAISEGSYGLLLCKWDKRERQGLVHVENAASKIESMQTRISNQSKLLPFLILPFNLMYPKWAK